MERREIKMGKLNDSFNNSNYQSITFCVTEECNLRCKYCYMTHKNSFRRMSIEVAKEAVDYYLSQPVETEAVAWEFIGGEPLLEIALIDELCDYIKYEMFRRDHPWFKKYMFSFSSNGLLYSSEAVQDYIKRNKNHISIGITIDGTKAKHDLQRVFPNGDGSYDQVIENVRLWMKQFPHATTKVTFASDDIKYLKESIIHLWDLGLKHIPANVVFEDVWKDGDDLLLEEQLLSLADYILENELWWDYSVRFFDPALGYSLGSHDLQTNFCGSGRMTAIDCEGNLYPCIRFLDFCMPSKDISTIKKGNIAFGEDQTVVDAFKALTIDLVSDDECKACPIAFGCFACAGNNLCYTESNTVFKRTKFHCNMHKAQVRANEYFWYELGKRISFPTPHEQYKMRAYRDLNHWQMPSAKYLYIILQDNMLPHCQYKTRSDSDVKMSTDLINMAFEFARKNYMVPVILGDEMASLTAHQKNTFHLSMPSSNIDEAILGASEVTEVLPIINSDTYEELTRTVDSCILSIDAQSVDNLQTMVSHLAQYAHRINIIPCDIMDWDDYDIARYNDQLVIIKNMIDEKDLGEISINLFDHDNHVANCHSGTKNVTLAPDGNFYLCPAFYFGNHKPIGNVNTGYDIPDVDLLGKQKAPYCRSCNNYSCLSCYYINYEKTGMINIPPKKKCSIHEIESRVN